MSMSCVKDCIRYLGYKVKIVLANNVVFILIGKTSQFYEAYIVIKCIYLKTITREDRMINIYCTQSMTRNSVKGKKV